MTNEREKGLREGKAIAFRAAARTVRKIAEDHMRVVGTNTLRELADTFDEIAAAITSENNSAPR